MSEYNAFFAGLVMNAMNEYLARQTLSGVTVTADEAQLFAVNATTVVKALLDTGIKLAPPRPS